MNVYSEVAKVKKKTIRQLFSIIPIRGAQCLSGRVPDLRLKGRWIETDWRYCVLS